VIDGVLGQTPAGREAGVSRTDDDRRDVFDDGSPLVEGSDLDSLAGLNAKIEI
jgi:hypothetical protein